MKITVARQKFIEALTETVNQSNLPAFVVADVLKSCLEQVNILAQQQLEADLREETEDGTDESDIH